MSVYHDVDWTLVSFEKPKPVTATFDSPFGKVTAPAPTACPHCGKALKPRGRHFHIRACKGKP
jgi:hypothetical protein